MLGFTSQFVTVRETEVLEVYLRSSCPVPAVRVAVLVTCTGNRQRTAAAHFVSKALGDMLSAHLGGSCKVWCRDGQAYARCLQEPQQASLEHCSKHLGMLVCTKCGARLLVSSAVLHAPLLR